MARWAAWQRDKVSAIFIEGDEKGRKHRETHIIVAYAGTIAQRLLTSKAEWGRAGFRRRYGAISDVSDIDNLMDSVWAPDEEEREAYLRWLWYYTRGLLKQDFHWAAVKALADELLKERRLGERRARSLIREAMEAFLVGT